MHKFKKGFTLAEVVITLAIIGVIAALTIPTLIYGVIDKKYTTFLKKYIYSLNEAIITSIAQNDKNTSSTAITTNDSLAKFFKPYLNVLKDNGAGVLWLSDGSKMGFVSVGPNASPCVSISTPSNLGTLANSCYVIVDVNGDKGPNTVSTVASTSDVYILGINPKSVVPVGEANSLTITTIPSGFVKDINGNTITTNPYADAIPGNASFEAITGST
jgi:prepilin-type N-terminal cleavage/methylation domain-containing protein